MREEEEKERTKESAGANKTMTNQKGALMCVVCVVC